MYQKRTFNISEEFYLAICEAALINFGEEHQVRKTIEELLELALALTHFLDGKVTQEAVVEEIADVNIMLLQLSMMEKFNKGFYQIEAAQEVKIMRLAKLLKIVDEKIVGIKKNR